MSKRGMRYARLYHEGATINLGYFATTEECEAARAGALVMLKRIKSLTPEVEAEPPEPKPDPDKVADKVMAAVQSGKFDPYLDELALTVMGRAQMLKGLPKQVPFGKPVIKPRVARTSWRG